MNKKENWLRLIKNDSPGWIGTPWEPFKGFMFGDIFIMDPIQAFAGGKRVENIPYVDGWGTAWIYRSGEQGPTPYITDENKVVKDITQWKDSVVFPPLDDFDWTTVKEFVDSVDRNENMIMAFVPGGLFERSHYLMGFEDALCNYMIEPEIMYELIGAIADWKIGHLERLAKYVKPDVVFFHDDWGDKRNLFLPPDIWRQIIKPHHKRIVESVKSNGVMFMHHSDTICEPIVEDMAEIGIDVWQGAIPQNDIVAIQKRLNGRMAIIGGIDAQVIDVPNADEEVIRKEVRRSIDTYCPQGYFIPCIPNILPMYPEVRNIYEDELTNYGKNYFKR